MKDFKVDAESYLNRAAKRLAESSPEALFYAALELRAGVEARLQEYLEPHSHVSDTKKFEWRIGRLVQTNSNVFQSDGQITRVRIRDQESGELVLTAHHTPVSVRLKAIAERLGDFLHAQEFRQPDDPWWHETRCIVSEGVALLTEACAGELLGPPLTDKSTGRTSMPMIPTWHSKWDAATVSALKGRSMQLEIRTFATLADARELI